MKKNYKEIDIKIILNSLDCNNKVPGVWALFGTQKNQWFCLQVGETVDIAHEINIDIERIRTKQPVINTIKYINQFGEEMFTCSKSPSVQEVEYNEISNKYVNLTFIYIATETNKDYRKMLEKYFAWNAHALYWRNGGSYQKKTQIDFDELLAAINKNTPMYIKEHITQFKRRLERTDVCNELKKYILKRF